MISTGPKKSRQIWRDMLATASIMAVAVLLAELLLFLGLTSQNLILVYILSILIIARCTTGYLYGMFAAVASTFIFDFLVTTPRLGFSFTIGFPITLFIMLTVSLVFGAVTTQMKKQAALAQERERRAELVYEVNQKLLAARDINEISRLAVDYLDQHLRLPIVFYARASESPHSYKIIHSTGSERDIGLFNSEAQKLKAESILSVPHEHDADIIVNPPVSYIPVLSKGSVLGLIGVIGLSDPPESNTLSFLQMLTGQVTFAMELQYVFDQQQSIRLYAEKEKMRGILLRAISHDLRTPLTGILSASSIIEDQADTLDSFDVRRLAMDIKDNSEWLIRMVENLLAVTRISDGIMKVKKNLEVAEEIMAQSVSIVRKRFPDCRIHVKASEDPLLVPMDAILISQVLINLLENAVKNSPTGSPIQLELFQTDGFAQFLVSDRGRGIPGQILDNLFEAHVSVQGQVVDSVSGIGIGLSICKTIIAAHDGKITGYNKPDGGAMFTVMLPLEPV